MPACVRETEEKKREGGRGREREKQGEGREGWREREGRVLYLCGLFGCRCVCLPAGVTVNAAKEVRRLLAPTEALKAP